MIAIPIVILSIVSDEDRLFMTNLYCNFQALMFKTAWKFTQTSSDAEDIVSDSCVSLIEKISKLRTMCDSELRKYIIVTVRNTANNFIYRKQLENTRFLQIDDKFSEQLQDGSSVEKKIALDDELNYVRQTIQKLPDKEQAILYLKFFQGETDKEISQIIGISENSVRKYIERARKRLKTEIYGGAEI